MKTKQKKYVNKYACIKYEGSQSNILIILKVIKLISFLKCNIIFNKKNVL